MYVGTHHDLVTDTRTILASTILLFMCTYVPTSTLAFTLYATTIGLGKRYRIWMCFIFGQIKHVTQLLQVHTTKSIDQLNSFSCVGLKKPKWAKCYTIEYLFLMKNCDMCYLSQDKTHPNRSSMSKNFYKRYPTIRHESRST